MMGWAGGGRGPDGLRTKVRGEWIELKEWS